jgi:hypothetical protein
MANLSEEDGTLAIQNAADLLGRTDEQLLAALPYTNVQAWRLVSRSRMSYSDGNSFAYRR